MGTVSRIVSSITLLFSCQSWNYPTQDQCLGEVGFPLVLETPTTPSEEKPWVPAVLSDLSSVLVGTIQAVAHGALRLSRHPLTPQTLLSRASRFKNAFLSQALLFVVFPIGRISYRRV